MPGHAVRDMRFTAAAIAVLLSLAASSAAAQGAKARPLFVPTPEEVVERMLRIAGTGPRDFVMDLGSGDGRIVIAAARNFGARGLGVDIDDELVVASRANARRAGVADRVAFEERDMFGTNLSRATVATVYQLPSLLDRLQPKFLEELRPGARIVSHAFMMKGWRPDRTEKVKHVLRYGWLGDGAPSIFGLCRRGCAATGRRRTGGSASTRSSSGSRSKARRSASRSRLRRRVWQVPRSASPEPASASAAASAPTASAASLRARGCVAALVFARH